MKRRESGFSLLEMVIVLTISLVVAGIMFINTRDAVRNQRADGALQDVLAMTRTAHQLAIDKRRVFMVTYSSTLPNQMTLPVPAPSNSSAGCGGATSQWPDAPSTAANPTPVLGNFNFAWVTGAPNTATTAPDGFTGGSTTTPIALTSTVSPSLVCFYPDGSARDANNQFTSGVVYLAPSTASETSGTVRLNNMRAMTIFGPTGRISGWRLTQTSTGLQWKMW